MTRYLINYPKKQQSPISLSLSREREREAARARRKRQLVAWARRYNFLFQDRERRGGRRQSRWIGRERERKEGRHKRNRVNEHIYSHRCLIYLARKRPMKHTRSSGMSREREAPIAFSLASASTSLLMDRERGREREEDRTATALMNRSRVGDPSCI